jgi:hypothetical protein
VANRRMSAASRYGNTAPERRRHSVINQGGKMSRIIITMSRTIFFRKWLEARGRDMARFDAMAERKRVA